MKKRTSAPTPQPVLPYSNKHRTMYLMGARRTFSLTTNADIFPELQQRWRDGVSSVVSRR
jgi:hypothetical protein